MDFDCPQYVDFNSEGFLEDTDSYVEKSESKLSLQNADSPERETEENEDTVGCDPELEQDEQPVEGEEDFYVHRREDNTAAKQTAPRSTVAKPFHFATDDRFGVKAQKNPRLESTSISSGKAKLRITVPEPFNLSKPAKKVCGEPYIPLAEQINAFQNKTPERFHSTAPQEFQSRSHWSPQRVQAKTPKFRAVKRNRPLVTLSQEEREEQELAEMKSYKFHAQPLDPKIYTASKDNHTKKESPEKEHTFKARPIPKGILKGPKGLKRKQAIPVTNPKSPNFLSESRLVKRRKFEQDKKRLSIVKESRSSKSRSVSIPAKDEPLRPTVVVPFSFDKADKERQMEKEKRIQQKLEEEKPRQFKARPIPSLTPTKLPQVEKKLNTIPEPFHLSEANNITIVDENTKPPNFKANPATVLTKDPFVPEKSKKPPVEIKEFTLHTDKRASDHKILQEEKEAREMEREEALSKLREIEERREQEEIKQLRREMVHKAQPIRNYKTVNIQASDKPLTTPVSPNFSTSKR